MVLELPEVEVLRKDIEKEIVGKRVKDVMVETASLVRPFHRTRPQFIEALEGHKIEGVRRRGAMLFLDLDDEMTWIIDPGSRGTLHRETSTTDAGEHTHLVVTFTIGSALHLTDTKDEPTSRTGVVPTAEVYEAAGMVEEALDPLEDNPTWPEFGHLLHEHAMPLKQLLVDRSIVLGLGDVYSDEVLWESGLRFDRRSDTLTTQEVRRLYRAMQEVIAAAIKHRGSSLDESQPEEVLDEEGEVHEHIRVYGREGMPCYRCRQIIVRERIKTRLYTYFCPQCQI